MAFLMAPCAFALEDRKVSRDCSLKVPISYVAYVNSSSNPEVIGMFSIILLKTSASDWLIMVRHFSISHKRCTTLIEFSSDTPVMISQGGDKIGDLHLDEIWQREIKTLHRKCERKRPRKYLRELREGYTVRGMGVYIAPIDTGSFVGCNLLVRSVIGSAIVDFPDRSFYLTTFMGQVKIFNR